MATRRMTAHTNTLPPVPPTPADWVDTDAVQEDRSRPLQIITSPDNRESSTSRDADFTAPAYEQPSSFGHTRTPSTSSLSRAGARRDLSAKGLRERRYESRGGQVSNMEIKTAVEPRGAVPWAEPTDKALTRNATINTPSPGLRRTSATRPRFRDRGPSSNDDEPTSASSALTVHAPSPRVPTPKSVSSRTPGSYPAPTPPFSPDSTLQSPPVQDSAQVGPKTLPTPPPSQTNGVNKTHLTTTGDTNSQQLSPARLRHMEKGSAEIFERAAIDRHNAFIEREMGAKSDRERVKIFAEFIVTESRIRRDRYADAIDRMGLELLELTRGLFQPYSTGKANASRSNVASPTESSDGSDRRASISSTMKRGLRVTTPDVGSASESEPQSPNSASSRESHSARPDSGNWGHFKPQLSPIASVNMSEARDEMSSRGRTPSRWWESSEDGGNGDRAATMERSKRESKFMGVPREVRESLQQFGTVKGPSGSAQATGSDYPPEKVSEKTSMNYIPPPPPPPAMLTPSPGLPRVHTPDPNRMDVSRLVTLPPPYPRHFPAVNNAHPDLNELRASFRALSDTTEVTNIKEAYKATTDLLLEQQEAEAADRKAKSRQGIQHQVQAGTITYADAARMEAEFAEAEAEIAKNIANAKFDRYQSEVIKPLNPLLGERVGKATGMFDQLKSELFVESQGRSPNMPQEAGDEQPELLEKLTVLKWLFEAREQIHSEIFELTDQRSNEYKTKILTLYRLAGKEEKCDEAELFFAQDYNERKIKAEREALERLNSFYEIIEENVARGVEVQLSAFWDIAPGLRTIIEKIPPNNLAGFQIQIPFEEYQDNPSYEDHPLQYLYTLLNHAEKSSYQFIESQTSLLCLLHEVKTNLMAAKYKLYTIETKAADQWTEELQQELKVRKEKDDKRYTDDLKEKVKTVEGQWEEALGRRLTVVKMRVKTQLVEEGAWEELSE
jgi:hypothetical protein